MISDTFKHHASLFQRFGHVELRVRTGVKAERKEGPVLKLKPIQLEHISYTYHISHINIFPHVLGR